LFRIEPQPATRNVPSRPGSRDQNQPKPAFELSHLISAYSGLDATAEGGTPHLLECAVRALLRQPVQMVAMTDAAGVTTERQITLLVEQLPLDQLTGLWTALQAELQPSVICLARPVAV
jgi:hypothetical protein